ncbi:hypothetical protein DM860_009487 [Cuscuta australis]|uniref:Uncharacterized protein n=1 Tax=Cuscuta australis TaxID=267555 RepID=A0A328DNM4_9ASTE|nr:hypothetical protein DM860_009487 [Cuscuta australis]
MAIILRNLSSFRQCLISQPLGLRNGLGGALTHIQICHFASKATGVRILVQVNLKKHISRMLATYHHSSANSSHMVTSQCTAHEAVRMFSMLVKGAVNFVETPIVGFYLTFDVNYSCNVSQQILWWTQGRREGGMPGQVPPKEIPEK